MIDHIIEEYQLENDAATRHVLYRLWAALRPRVVELRDLPAGSAYRTAEQHVEGLMNLPLEKRLIITGYIRPWAGTDIDCAGWDDHGFGIGILNVTDSMIAWALR